MSCSILTPERWELLLENGLTKEETAELITHLESACPDCDRFLSQIKGSTEHDLRQMFNDIPVDEIDFLKEDSSRKPIQKTNPSDLVNTSAGSKQADDSLPSPVATPKRRLLTALLGGTTFSPVLASGIAVFALLTVGVLVQLQVEDVPMRTEKGISEPEISSLNLQFATGHKLDEDFIVKRGVNGGQYTHNDTLYLHYELPVKGYVYLIGYQGQGNVDILYPSNTDRAIIQDVGQYSLPAGNAANKGIPLDNIHGRYIVIGVYSPDSLNPDKQIFPLLEESVDIVSGSVDKQKIEILGKDIVVDVIYFDVQA